MDVPHLNIENPFPRFSKTFQEWFQENAIPVIVYLLFVVELTLPTANCFPGLKRCVRLCEVSASLPGLYCGSFDAIFQSWKDICIYDLANAGRCSLEGTTKRLDGIRYRK